MTAPSRLPAVIAGCFAIAASLTTMGVIVVSDIAEARESSDLSTLSDELPEVPLVKMTPTRVAVEPELQLMDPFGDSEEAQKAASGIFKRGKGKRARVNFGAFEGY
jgi:hypothetical protein